jgi:hypothetical protein
MPEFKIPRHKKTAYMEQLSRQATKWLLLRRKNVKAVSEKEEEIKFKRRYQHFLVWNKFH